MAPQDHFLDDEEDFCPLCIEEFDLNDKNFFPCPCGYQVCQFCFNNIRSNMNGLCPACRRPYDDKTIKYKLFTPEEAAQYNATQAKNQKKKAQEQRARETQKREAEKESRKNLVGVRVVQKNLVYVTGLTPTVKEDELLKTLRKPEFFGQYGTIQKISISNRKTSDGQNQSLGIYVTFEKPEEAASCITAVNGSHNGDRVLKAQLGTTKYCSAWLRYEQCTNRLCMFLHELGDEADSYTRQDLSSMNSLPSQRLGSGSQQGGTASTPRGTPLRTTLQVASSSHSMARSSSKDGGDHDGSALPSSANWARTQQQRSRRGSHATASSSPAVSMSTPAGREDSAQLDGPPPPALGHDKNKNRPVISNKDPTPAQAAAQVAAVVAAQQAQKQEIAAAHAAQAAAAAAAKAKAAKEAAPQVVEPPREPTPPPREPTPVPEEEPEPEEVEAPVEEAAPEPEADEEPVVPAPTPVVESTPRTRILADLKGDWNFKPLTAEDHAILARHPPLFSLNGGQVRRPMREREVADLASTSGQAIQSEASQDTVRSETEELESSGSLALGGEPEDRQATRDAFAQRSMANQYWREPAFANGISNAAAQASPQAGLVGNRSMTPQQQLYMRTQSGLADHTGSGLSTPNSGFPLPTHNRQASRIGFEPVAGSSQQQMPLSQRLLTQQRSAAAQQNAYNQANQYYPTSVSGPPPGLKPTSTPPTGMFNNQAAFGSGFVAPAKDGNDVMFQNLFRGTNQTQVQAQVAAQAQAAAGKREYINSLFSSNQYPTSSLTLNSTSSFSLASIPATASAQASSLLATLYEAQQQQTQHQQQQHVALQQQHAAATAAAVAANAVAFTDYGVKPKKKGKKNPRHANTSSSGGSGLVDLSDSNILQARMQQQAQAQAQAQQQHAQQQQVQAQQQQQQQQQQQGAGGVGLGLGGVGVSGIFNGQAPTGYPNNMVYNAAFTTRW